MNAPIRPRHLTDEQVWTLNERHGWFQYRDAQSDVSRQFAHDAIELYFQARVAAIPTVESLLSLICDYDPRHPDYQGRVEDCEDAGFEVPSASAPDCVCNNCLSGRAPLASALLAMIGERA